MTLFITKCVDYLKVIIRKTKLTEKLDILLKIEYLLILVIALYFISRYIYENKITQRIIYKQNVSIIESNRNNYGIENCVIIFDSTKYTELNSYDLMPKIIWITGKTFNVTEKVVLLCQYNEDSTQYYNVPIATSLHKGFIEIIPQQRLQPRRHMLAIENVKDGKKFLEQIKTLRIIYTQPLYSTQPDVGNDLLEVKNAIVKRNDKSSYYKPTINASFAQIRTKGYSFSEKVELKTSYRFLSRIGSIQFIFGEAHAVFFEKRGTSCKIGVTQAMNIDHKRQDRRYELGVLQLTNEEAIDVIIVRRGDHFSIECGERGKYDITVKKTGSPGISMGKK